MDESLNLSESSTSFVSADDDIIKNSFNFSSRDYSAMVSDISISESEYKIFNNKVNQ